MTLPPSCFCEVKEMENNDSTLDPDYAPGTVRIFLPAWCMLIIEATPKKLTQTILDF